jgi:hypothetical protein
MKVPFLGLFSLLIALWVVNGTDGKSINGVSPKPSITENVRQTHPTFSQVPSTHPTFSQATTLGDSIKSNEVVVKRDAIVSDFVILLQLSVNNTITSYDCIEQTHCYTLLLMISWYETFGHVLYFIPSHTPFGT